MALDVAVYVVDFMDKSISSVRRFLYVAVVGFKSYSMHDGFMLAIPEKGCEEQTELQWEMKKHFIECCW